jgi:type IV pilus assembly protein PilV
VGMQAQAINHTSQAKYRADAAFLANKLIGQMWADAPANRTSYATGGTKFNVWKTQELYAYLPPGSSSAAVTVTTFTPTQLQIVGGPAMAGHRVTIQIQWRGPNEPTSMPAHIYNMTTDIVSPT